MAVDTHARDFSYPIPQSPQIISVPSRQAVLIYFFLQYCQAEYSGPIAVYSLTLLLLTCRLRCLGGTDR